MDQFIRGSSSYTRLVIHVTFKAKYCHEVFNISAFKNRCEQIFREVAAEQGVQIIEIGFDRDHVHMIWQIKIFQSISDIAKSFKGTSGKMLLKEFKWVKRKYFWGSGLWAGTIYADSCGKNPQQMKEYVRNQGKARITKNQLNLANFMPPVYGQLTNSNS